MAPDKKRDPDKGLSAGIEERFFAPLKRNVLASRSWFLLAVAVGLVLHIALVAWLLRRDKEAPPVAVAQQEETPVEVVVEPPKPKDEPKPPVPPPPPPPQAKQEIEKPATSAPRAPQEQTVDTTALDKETHAPKADAPPTDGQPQPSLEASSPEDAPAQHDKYDQAADKQPDVLKNDAEALDIAVPEPPKKPEQFAKAKPTTKHKRDKTALKQVAGDLPLPDWAFARASKHSPVYGGSEDDRYLSEVFGLIMRQYRDVPVPDPTVSVTVDFQIADDGSLVGMRVAQSSGYEELDAAAMTAVSRAAPFPALPPGSPHGLSARISALSHHGDYTLGQR